MLLVWMFLKNSEILVKENILKVKNFSNFKEKLSSTMSQSKLGWAISFK